MSDEQLTYESSGVSISAQDQAIESFTDAVQATHGREVLAGVGSFGAAFAPVLAGVQEPVLVSSTDGVGTKVKLHSRFGTHRWAGADIVAAVVNDVICSGAKPMFFLDYLACNQVKPEVISELVSGMADSCKQIGCALIGGEIAEMGDVYQPGEYDLAGFCVGLVDKASMLGAENVRLGDRLIGIASNGVHCNGFSLVRAIFEKLPDEKWQEPLEGTTVSMRDALLKPTHCYVKPVLAAMGNCDIHAAAHISGGGLIDNLPRVIPPGLLAVVDRDLIPKQPVFDIIQRLGNVSWEEMFHVFNMGIGFVLITSEDQERPIIEECDRLGFKAKVIGEVKQANGSERFILQN